MIEADEDLIGAPEPAVETAESYSKGEPILVQLDSREPNLGIELLGAMQKEGTKRGLSFLAVEASKPYHVRIAVTGEQSMAGSQTGAVVLTSSCEVLTSVIRSGRLSRSGAARAVGKQLAKDIAALAEIGGLGRALSP